tara:strand:- start:15 stop:740 length:726 start_codon:yes stop_codon:yes gene_type:complete
MVHIGIIPDGNRRWCKSKDIEYKLTNLQDIWFNILLLQLRELSINSFEFLEKVTSLTFYVCSIENIRRNDNTSEYIYLFLNKLFILYNNYEKIIDELYKNETEEKKTFIRCFIKGIIDNLNIVPIGELHELPENIRNELLLLKKQNKKTNKYNLYLGIAYDFNKDLINFGVNTNENYNREQSQIDILIRTGGELRLSGFFPTHINYAEFFYFKKYWPDITCKDINNAIYEFINKRQRRYGK